MSKYTTEVRFICETYAGYSEPQERPNVNAIIEKARSKIFDFDYPIFDANYKGILEHKILRHYYTREIALETVGLWKLQLENTMCELMPYFNKLYESELLAFNPLYDTDYKIESNRNRADDEDTTSNHDSDYTRTDNLKSHTQGENTDLYSDTPQGSLTGVESQTYLTNARKVDGDSTTDNTGTQRNKGVDNTTGTRDLKSTEDYAEHVFGKRGGQSYASMLHEFRDSFLNIDMMVIESLSDLFFNLY